MHARAVFALVVASLVLLEAASGAPRARSFADVADVMSIASLTAPALQRLRSDGRRLELAAEADGIPPGVDCDAVQRCDGTNVCARVCAKGSVRIGAWQQWATAYQWRLARRQPLCFAQLLGTHNSAVTMADGYGMHDPIYTQYIRYLGLGGSLQTNNQVLSLTDQLNLGVRFVEIDVHWIQGRLQVAHCGGFHSARLNQLVALMNSVARLFGRPPLEWDAETLGCNPSLSSLPTRDQRVFSDAVAEVAAWLALPASAAEFIVLYLDDQADLQTWGRVGELLQQVTDAIPASLIVSPAELQAIQDEQGGMPSIEQLVRRYGKRVLLMSATDYGADMSWLAHHHWQLCNFTEPLFRDFSGSPGCAFLSDWYPGNYLGTARGRLIRTPTCHLTYGPYNCSMQLGENVPQLDASLLTDATACGINVPAPDMLTPDLAAKYVWSWATDHPPQQPAANLSAAHGAAAEAEQQQRQQRQQWQRYRRLAEAPAAAEQCAMMRSGDGRWVVRPCGDAGYVACRRDSGPEPSALSAAWALVPAPPRDGPRGGGDSGCPAGYGAGAPHSARESLELHQALRALVGRQRQSSQLQAAEAQAAEAQVQVRVEGREAEREGGKEVEEGEVEQGEQEEVFALLALQPPSWLPAALAGQE